MKIVAQPKEWIALNVAKLQGQNEPWGNYTAIALVSDDGYFKAGVVYNRFERANICGHISIAPGAMLTPAFIRAMFEYPFLQLGKERITAAIARKNKKAVRFVRHLGFTYEGCLRRYYGNDDMHIYGILKDEAVTKGLIPQERKAA